MPEEHWILAIENPVGNSALLFPSNQRLFSRWFGLLHIPAKHWSWEFGSLPRAGFLPQSDLDHQAESLHDDLIIESTAFRLLLHPIHSLFLRLFSPRRAQFCPQDVQSVRCVLSWLAYFWCTWDLVRSSFHEKTPLFQGFFVSAERFELSTVGLKESLGWDFLSPACIYCLFCPFFPVFWRFFRLYITSCPICPTFANVIGILLAYLSSAYNVLFWVENSFPSTAIMPLFEVRHSVCILLDLKKRCQAFPAKANSILIELPTPRYSAYQVHLSLIWEWRRCLENVSIAGWA